MATSLNLSQSSQSSQSSHYSTSGSSVQGSPMSEYFKTDKDYYATQVTYMFKEQLYSSVLDFGSVALSIASKFPDIMTETQEVNVLMMCGDSAYATNDYILAETYYRKVLHLYKSLKSLPNFKEILPEDCSNDAKYKLYLCYMHFKKSRDALAMLQSIPAKSRTVRTNLALGRLYMQSGMERPAITSFKEVLRECPTAMEAIESLIALGMKESDLQVFFTNRVNKMPQSEWFYQWIKGQQYLAAKDYNQSLQTYDQLHDEYCLQDNHYLLYTMANIYVLAGNYRNAIGALKHCHLREPSNMTGMDLLAFLLWWQADVKELERLSRRLAELNYNDSRPESWIAMAYTAQLNGRGQKGTSFATRAVYCGSNQNLEAHICRGYLLLDAKKITEATDCFREAIQINGNRFEPHNGLVTCYLEMKRYREATAIANFAMKKLGQTARVLTMCSQPLCKDPLNFAKAKTFLENALQLDPNFEPAVLQLSEILEMEGSYERAIQYISTLLDNGLRTDTSRVTLHNRLGHLWVKSNNDERAMDHFAIALRIDPNNREATDGLNRLDPATNRSAVHETTQAASFELVDEVEIDEEDDEQDLAEIDSEVDGSIWDPQQGDF